ncbi:MAG TPA: nucleoside-diphosphate sugar epimerase/dehydratase [Actinomycetaceae bacterium]|nr:nucleoside-diphosphate sugar epimerase/dehydratase [Actinomycetaceae bacterium]
MHTVSLLSHRNSKVAANATHARSKRVTLAAVDAISWFGSILVLGALFEYVDHQQLPWPSPWLYGVIAVACQLILGFVLKLYRGRYNVGSPTELAMLAGVVLFLGSVLGLVFALSVPGFPAALAATVPLGALVAMMFARITARLILTRRHLCHSSEREPVLVYGAGTAGRQLGGLLAYDQDSPFEIVGFVDDDPAKRNLHLSVGQVVGSGDDLVSLARRRGVHTVVFAIPSAPSRLLRRVSDEVDAAGLRLLVLPPVAAIIGGQVHLDQLREVNLADLLGRGQVTTNLDEIAEYLQGKVVLVTGAGGSIGSEIARQVHTLGPRELVLLDRDESGLHSVQLDIYGHGMLDTPDMVLCDIRDDQAVVKAFETHRPDVVYHAAALKHLPMLEQYPDEGWKTNVLGTLNVLEAAARVGVREFVNISTDKAADAVCVLGKTKRSAERLTSWFAKQSGGSYVSVRFGNVLGSRGSVLHTFVRQIDRGGPVTIVHPDVTRYFMTIPEACQLVVQAGELGNPGDVLVLDMGEPVRILDVARRLIWKSGKDVDIVFTGLRPGEKLHESLFSACEGCVNAGHPLISKVQVPPLDPEKVREQTLDATCLPGAGDVMRNGVAIEDELPAALAEQQIGKGGIVSPVGERAS